MCRKTLEGVCSEHGVKSGTLAAQLKKLKENGVIEGRLFEWADALRTIGNEAAHESSSWYRQKMLRIRSNLPRR
jgi:hypothetical protein